MYGITSSAVSLIRAGIRRNSARVPGNEQKIPAGIGLAATHAHPRPAADPATSSRAKSGRERFVPDERRRDGHAKASLAKSGFIAESIVRDAYVAIRLAQKTGALLVNVSTSEVYGGGINGLCKEDTPRVIRGVASARQEYAAGKLAVEVATENLCREGNLDAVTIRPFNVAGPRQSGRGGFVLPRFIGQAILGLPLTVFGDGRQLRAFTDVRDVAAGMTQCASRGTSGTVYNLGNPANRISISELADRVLEVCGSAVGKRHLDPRELYGHSYAEAADKFPDAGAMLRLGWEPAYGLDETIRDTFHMMRELPQEDLLKLSGLSSEETVRAALSA